MRKTLVMLLLALAVTALPALAEKNLMAGRWKASGGFIVTIPDGGETFDLVFERPGDRVVHPARWVKRGQQFTWYDKQNASHTSTLDTSNPDKIMDVNAAYPASRAFWYRQK